MSSCPTNPPSDPKATQTLVATIRGFFGLAYRTLSIGEAVLSIGLGAVLGTWLGKPTAIPWIVGSVIAILCYIPLLRLKLRAQWTLPEKLFDHLDAVEELKRTKKELQRKESIDLYIDSAIKALNAATCRISVNKEDDTCPMSAKDGLAEVLTSLIFRTQIVLDCDTSKFSVGAQVWLNQPGQDYGAETWLVFRDDLNVKEIVIDEPGDWRIVGADLVFHQAVETATFENRLVAVKTRIRDRNLQLICSPIPIVCDEESAHGVLWIYQECLDSPPQDLGNILLIFARIVANWLSKYHECLAVQSQSINQITADSRMASATISEDPSLASATEN